MFKDMPSSERLKNYKTYWNAHGTPDVSCRREREPKKYMIIMEDPLPDAILVRTFNTIAEAEAYQNNAHRNGWWPIVLIDLDNGDTFYPITTTIFYPPEK